MSAKTIEELQREIDLAWEMIEDGWDIEPRAYFEAQAPMNGFRSALAQAVHHMWKRKVKDEPVLQKAPPAMPPYDDVVEALRARVKELECDLARLLNAGECETVNELINELETSS